MTYTNIIACLTLKHSGRGTRIMTHRSPVHKQQGLMFSKLNVAFCVFFLNNVVLKVLL